MAFYCSHIAMHTIEADKNIMIYGPVIMNSEIICYKGEWEDVKTVGLNQGRVQERSLAEKTYPQIEEFIDISQKGILYSMEDGQVDAIIQDLTKAALVPNYKYKPLSDQDYISYVLVVNKEFAQTEAFADFVRSYNRAAEKLNEPAYLAEKLGVEESWLEDKPIKFLTLQESGE